ncbi:hypothetical protein CDAR_600781 [Caerostris darwini]|uniref:Uncharacterized protein n=1 Tax=Caerostris darwini TaxID=1538125 RepID=A0AAV4TTJ0_9ARAC|nr:hypothetical protein CDAR_600781 [Caerostris darwini]
MKKTALIHKRPSACLLYSISVGTSGLEHSLERIKEACEWMEREHFSSIPCGYLATVSIVSGSLEIICGRGISGLKRVGQKWMDSSSRPRVGRGRKLFVGRRGVKFFIRPLPTPPMLDYAPHHPHKDPFVTFRVARKAPTPLSPSAVRLLLSRFLFNMSWMLSFRKRTV